MSELWKSNWQETQQHFLDWWNRDGLVLGMWGAPKAATPHIELPDPGPPPLVEAYTDPELRARLNEFGMARCDFLADCLPLAEQCAWLDHSMFHLDGTQCLDKLDALLAVDELDAIEWTPQAGIENGGSPRWYPLYKRILEAGKSVQVLGVEPDEVIPLLDAVGGKGVYIMTGFKDRDEAETIMKKVDAFR